MTGQGRRNRRTLIALVAVGVGMGGASFAAVPLYRLFCQVTGFGGTTQVAVTAPEAASDRVITVRFNADTAGGMPWRFAPAQREMRVRVGEVALARYVAENRSAATVTGTATFNVTPYKVGRYFSKVQCFCFDEQTLAPGERAEMPVTFFVDPEILDDPNASEVNTITLSYTFFEVKTEAARERVVAATAGRPVD